MNKLLPFSAGLTAILGFSVADAAEPSKQVNFIVVYLDDMGYGDLGITGATGYTTPNINRMAHEGVFFTHYVSPQAVCSASRAGLLTGCYPNRVGFSGALDHTSRMGIHAQEETIAENLKKAGYSTAIFGKWHLGSLPQFLPTRHGFDHFYGIPYSNDMWPNHPITKNYYPPLPLYDNEKVVQENPDQSQFTTWFTEKSVDFIRQHRSKPFFLYLAHPMPHVPLFVSNKFKGKSEQGLYGDVMMEIDWSIGQLLKTIHEEGLDENTLVIFTSDNGPWINYGNHAGSTGGLREGKGTSYEGGQRVPCLMRWRGTIPAGTVCHKLLTGMDILPTLSEIAGTSLPQQKIDGISVLPLMKGDTTVNPRKSFYYYYRRNSLEAVSNGNWKLVFAHKGRTYEGFLPGNNGTPGQANENAECKAALYDLRRDPGERYDVMEHYPEIVAELEALAGEARKELGDDLTGAEGTSRRKAGVAE